MTMTETNTSGGASVGGNVNAQGDFVGRGKHVHGDEVHDNKVADARKQRNHKMLRQ